MGQLVDGAWQTNWYKNDEQGHFLRPKTKFHGRITPVRGRYHLYVSYACPWATRTIIARAWKGLEGAVGLSVVDPFMGEDGWAFTEEPEPLYGVQYLRELYVKARPDYTGRVTVPVLWDRETHTIVNNESREIVRMLDMEMGPAGANEATLYPVALREAIEAACDAIYEPINNGVYRAGFATSQGAYEEAAGELFAALDHWEGVLAKQRFMCGDVITAADMFLFTTLYRFDAVYYSHFKCNVRRIKDYPGLSRLVHELLAVPAVRDACHMDHVKQHYYRSHPQINPTRIVPIGPADDFA